MVTPKFASSTLSVHAELKKRVAQYFQDTSVAQTGNHKLYSKAIILVSSYIAVYVTLVFFTPAAWLAIPLCMLLGLLTSAIGFNIMHDGAHKSFSKHTGVNKVAAFSLDMLGASSYMWNQKHNIVHHTYTNIDGIDDDIDARPFLRLTDSQKRYRIHKYQHLYFWLPYSLLYMFWVFFADFKKYFSQKIGNVALSKLKATDHWSFWGFKVLYVVTYVAVPIYFCGFLPWVVGFLTYSCLSGLILSIVFQLAHTVEETAFPLAVQPVNKMEDEWALHQLKTTANFATRNRFITWWVGGLNFQIEHHLFPKISHVHYPGLSKVIKQACADLNVPYIEHRKMQWAIASHVSYLKKMGKA